MQKLSAIVTTISDKQYLFQYIFHFPLSLKLHGDVGISASGRRKDYVAM